MADANPLELTPEEAMTVLEDSGGFIVARYTKGKRQNDTRYNPYTNQFEQITVLQHEDEEPELVSYENLPRHIALSLFQSAYEAGRAVTSIVEYPESNFSAAKDFPDSL